MNIRIETLNYDIFHCYLNVMCVLAQWLRNEYEKLFSYSIHFGYDKNQKKMGDMIELISYEDSDRLTNDMYGINVKWHPKDNLDTIMMEIKKNIDSNLPVITFIDTFYCPWIKHYRKDHTIHYILITDIDKDNNLMCIDSYYCDDVTKLDFGEFKYGFGDYMTISIMGAEHTAKDHTAGQLLCNSISKIRTYNVFDTIREFAGDLLAGIDIKSECQGYTFYEANPLFYKIGITGNGRDNYARFLEYCEKKSEEKFLSDPILSFRSSYKKWEAVKNLLFKASFENDPKSTYQVIYNKLNEIADMEEKTFNGLSEKIGI